MVNAHLADFADTLGIMHEQKISNLPQDQDLPTNDLRNFLANKIREVQERSDPLTLKE